MRRRGIEGVAERYCQSYRRPFAGIIATLAVIAGCASRDGLPAVSITGLVVGPEVAAAQFAREKAATPSKVEGATKLSPKDPPACWLDNT
jgi:hypothetical protein